MRSNNTRCLQMDIVWVWSKLHWYVVQDTSHTKALVTVFCAGFDRNTSSVGVPHFYAIAGVFWALMCPDNKMYWANIAVVKNTYLKNFWDKERDKVNAGWCQSAGRSARSVVVSLHGFWMRGRWGLHMRKTPSRETKRCLESQRGEQTQHLQFVWDSIFNFLNKQS